MTKIDLFLQSLKRGNFKIQNYDYEKSQCEFSHIAAMIHQRHIPGIIEFLSTKEGPYFEVKHPFYDVILRAVYSINLASSVNVVFFSDKTNQHILAILQVCNFINYFICEDSCFVVSEAWQGARNGALGELISEVRKNNIKNEDLKFREVQYGFILNHHRPAHYFHHILVNYIQLPQRLISKEKSYFYPKHSKFADNLAYFIPFTYLHQNCDLLYSRVYEESLQQFQVLIETKDLQEGSNNSLTLWLGIPGERRVWLQQWEGIPLILKNLSLYFPSIKVYVDGMTAYDGERIEVTSNLEAFWKIVENTKEAFEVDDSTSCKDAKQASSRNDRGDSKNSCVIYGAKGEQIAFKSLSGYDYRTKICYCSMCDIAISECSTTALVPFNFCQKPGVVFGLADTLGVHSQELARSVPFLYAIEEHCLISTFLGEVEWIASMPPEHLYNLAAESLEEISKEGKLTNFRKENPLKMHRLPVPAVELYDKKHALEEKYKVKFTLQEVALHCELLQKQEEILENSNSDNPKMQDSNPLLTKLTGAVLRVKNHLAYKIRQSLGVKL